MADVNLTVRCDGMDEINEKAKQIVDKLKEARTLAGELTSILDGLEINIDSGKRETREIKFCVDGKEIAETTFLIGRDFRRYGLTARRITDEWPEQYDVYDDKQHIVGYIRVKNNLCEAYFPDADSNDLVYIEKTNGNMSFNRNERNIHMNRALYAIQNWCNKHPGVHEKEST